MSLYLLQALLRHKIQSRESLNWMYSQSIILRQDFTTLESQEDCEVKKKKNWNTAFISRSNHTGTCSCMYMLWSIQCRAGLHWVAAKVEAGSIILCFFLVVHLRVDINAVSQEFLHSNVRLRFFMQGYCSSERKALQPNLLQWSGSASWCDCVQVWRGLFCETVTLLDQ